MPRKTERDLELRRLVHDVRNSVGAVQLRLLVLERGGLSAQQAGHVAAVLRELGSQAETLKCLSRLLDATPRKTR